MTAEPPVGEAGVGAPAIEDARFDDLARRAGAALRTTAPDAVLARITHRARRRQAAVTATKAGAGAAVVVAFVALLVWRGQGDEAPVDTTPTTPTTPATPATPSTTTTTLYPVLAGEPWVAYQTDAPVPAVRLIRPDGTGAHDLVPAVPGAQQHPDWSPDGARLAFAVTGAPASSGIWTVAADGTGASRLVVCDAPCQWADEPAWSPDGRPLAYQRWVFAGGQGTSTIEVVDVATGVTRVIEPGSAGELLGAPRWSPDGRRLVIEVAGYDTPDADPVVLRQEVAVLTLDASSGRQRITDPSLLANNPDWSPTGDLIVLAGVSGTGQDLYTVRADGSGLVRITDVGHDAGQAIKPSFTPDGTRIELTMQTNEAATQEMITIDLAGQDQQPAAGAYGITGVHQRLRPAPG